MNEARLKATPVAFGDCAGWFHAGSSRHAVILCAPVGFEALCCRQSLHVLADLIARQGLNVLRFDYPGEGTSLAREDAEGLVPAAVRSIKAAETWLRTTAGMDTIHFAGLRLGATLMMEALADRADIGSIVMLAPVLRGRAYVRETIMTSQIIAEMRPGQDAGPGEINVCGFMTGADDVEAITALKLQAPNDTVPLYLAMEPDRPIPDFVQNGRPGYTVATFAGYAAMNEPPTQSVLPLEDFKALANWYAEQIGSAQTAVSAKEYPARLTAANFTETTLRFGQTQQLAGILCVPTQPKPGMPLVHILDAGANYHEGWAGMANAHARTLAGEGVASFRYDFSGIGDSIWFAEGPRPHIYAERHINDARAAIDAMEGHGYDTHVLSGLCAGAYVAFHAVARDPRIVGAVVANAIRLIWHEHDSLDSLTDAMLQPSAVYKQKALSPTQWKRVLRGEIPVTKIVRVIGNLANKLWLRAATHIGHEADLSPDNRIVRDVLVKATSRGAKVVFVHAERDQSRDETELHFGAGAKFALRQPGVVLIDVPNADHEMTPRHARDMLLDAVRLVLPTQK